MEKKLPPNFRQEFPSRIKRIVVKLGSQAVTFDQGGIDLTKMKNIVQDVASLHLLGIEVVLVSSGAIHTGLPHLPQPANRTIDYLQALSAIGQPILMKTYMDLFQEQQMTCAQVLLTHDDLKDRTRYLNARQTLEKLLQHKIIPILNENDSVSFAEISVGDNDQLAALVTQLLAADTLLLLTGPDGLFDQDPHAKHAKGAITPATHFATVPFDKNFEEIKLISKSKAGRGGMKTKLMAVRKLTPLGIGVVMSTYKDSTPIMRAMFEQVGTYFYPAPGKITRGRKSWLLTLVRNHCQVEVDQGAYGAITRGSSLLPSGIVSVTGNFKRGDCVGITHEGLLFAVGLAEYDSGEIKKIMGKHSREIYKILGHYITSVMIHRDNLAIKS